MDFTRLLSLLGIKGKDGSGIASTANPVPVELPTAQVTTLTPPAAITNYASETGGNLAAIKAKTDNIPAQGQALAAASLPVVLTDAQETALTPPAAITGFALAVTQTDGNQKTQLSGPLRSARVDAADTYTEMEPLPDQVGAGTVLTFTFASAVQLVWVRSIGDVSRAVIGSQTPTATLGAYCASDEPTPIVVNGNIVKVFAPSTVTKVAVYGCRYT